MKLFADQFILKYILPLEIMVELAPLEEVHLGVCFCIQGIILFIVELFTNVKCFSFYIKPEKNQESIAHLVNIRNRFFSKVKINNYLKLKKKKKKKKKKLKLTVSIL